VFSRSLYTACEVRKAFCKPKTISKAIWIEKSNSASYEARENSLDLALCEANLALCRAQPLLSREAKVKALLCPNREVNIASLPCQHLVLMFLAVRLTMKHY